MGGPGETDERRGAEGSSGGANEPVARGEPSKLPELSGLTSPGLIRHRIVYLAVIPLRGDQILELLVLGERRRGDLWRFGGDS